MTKQRVLAQAPAVEGIVNWGAHDPGMPTGACSPALLDEFLARFGPYPLEQGDFGVRSSFDMIPTLCELLGVTVPAGLSGRSLLAPSGRPG